jgi:hypothetical protein
MLLALGFGPAPDAAQILQQIQNAPKQLPNELHNDDLPRGRGPYKRDATAANLPASLTANLPQKLVSCNFGFISLEPRPAG